MAPTSTHKEEREHLLPEEVPNRKLYGSVPLTKIHRQQPQQKEDKSSGQHKYVPSGKIGADFKANYNNVLQTNLSGRVSDANGNNLTGIFISEGGEDVVEAETIWPAASPDNGGVADARRLSNDSSEVSEYLMTVPNWVFWLNMAMFGVALFNGGISVAMLSPFYVKEADVKGVSVSEAGLVLGSTSITMIVALPLFGKYFKRMGGARLVCFSGMFTIGIANILFGLLEWAPPSSFLGLSFVLRITAAIGDAAFICTTYPLVTKAVDPAKRGTVLSLMETIFGVGMMVGPGVGGFLYDAGGFSLPFIANGIGMSVLALTAPCWMRDIVKTGNGYLVKSTLYDSYESLDTVVSDSTTTDENVLSRPVTISYLSLCSKSVIVVPCLLMILGEMAVNWYVPSLEPFATQNFQLNSSVIGLLFSLEGLTYAAFSPLAGYFLDRGANPYLFMVLGAATTTVGLLVLAPMPFLNTFIPKSPYTTGAALFIVGAGTAATFIVTLTYMVEEGTMEGTKCERKGPLAMDDGDKDEEGAPLLSSILSDVEHQEQMTGMVTSLWMTSENIGAFLGTSLGGVAYDFMSFEDSIAIIAALQALAFVFVTGLWLRKTGQKFGSDRFRSNVKSIRRSSIAASPQVVVV